MAYGPIAAFLAEYFPARIRYTSVSVPYHIGNGWGGGLVPIITTSAYRGSLGGRSPIPSPYRRSVPAESLVDAGDAHDANLGDRRRVKKGEGWRG